MKRNTIIWLSVFAGFVFFCFYMRWEMERNRAKLTADVQNEISKAPANIIQSVSDAVLKGTINVDSNSPKTNAVLTPGGVLDDIAGVIKRTIEPGSTSATKATNTDLENVGGRVLDAATQTARKVDRIGLDATRMSDEQEIEFGAEMADAMTNQFTLVSESPAYARIARLMTPILDERSRKQIQYKFHVVESKMVNAFSLAGGHVYITTAFLNEFPSDAALVMALSHEVAHVELRHCVEKVQYVRLGTKTVGKVAMLGGVLYNALATPYTKDQEFDADKYGFLACRKAGWSAAELISLLTDLEAYEHRDETVPKTTNSESALETKLKNYFRSHPPTNERKMRLEALNQK